MVHAPTRREAISKMDLLCSQGISLKGPATNLHFVKEIVISDAFTNGDTLTNFLDVRFCYQARGIDVIAPGSYSTVQDYPARPSIGYGVPKSGPMDNISSRVANILVGNDPGQELLEITLSGPTLLFTASTVIAVCGATVSVAIDGIEKSMWSSVVLQKGQTLSIGSVEGAGCRVYLAVRGGFPNIPLVLGSKSTTPSLNFGGFQGRPLRQGDFLQLSEACCITANDKEYKLPPQLIPDFEFTDIYVLQGPHDSSDIMTSSDREMLYNSTWEVGHNSSRTGIRLLGGTPQWARMDGGEAGSHPSNYLE